MTRVDRATGAVLLGELELGPRTSGAQSATLRAVSDADHTWTIITRVESGQLAQISLFVDDVALGTGWDDYTEAKELARRAIHDAMLEASLGPAHRADDEHFAKEWTMPWGRVLSTHDPRGGTTDVQIIYRRA